MIEEILIILGIVLGITLLFFIAFNVMIQRSNKQMSELYEQMKDKE